MVRVERSVSVENFVYLYGVFYDPDRTSRPDPETHDVIIYTSPRAVNRTISSLLGVFSAGQYLSPDTAGNGFVCRREDMSRFEKIHDGKFVPF